MAQRMSNSAACREAGINRRTGTRWRYGRKVVDRAGRERVYAPIAEQRDTLEVSLRHVSEGERIVIAGLLRAKKSLPAIARELGRTPATISREIAVALFTAPAALHRTPFQRGAKPEIVRTSSRLAGAGMSVLMPGLSGSVLLVVDVVLGRVEGVIAGSATLLVCGGLWGLLPQLVRRHAARSEARADLGPPTGANQLGAKRHE
ncbi:DUF6328 family protein [Streptomyces sp. NPDC001401]|uniref:DUF6328 family protein n=1 Tax=Streptomyces sp. NPDC001401 TaxID=3364570 RepID=UPI0036CB7217